MDKYNDRLRKAVTRNCTYHKGGLNIPQLKRFIGKGKATTRANIIQEIIHTYEDGIHIRIFTQWTIPKHIQEYLRTKGAWDALCRGSIPWEDDGVYQKNALDSATYIFVAIRNDQVVGFLFGLDHHFISPLTKKPVCKSYELYIDVVCAIPGVGKKLIDYYFLEGYRQKKFQIRLYGIESSRGMWQQTYGFVESELDTPNAIKSRLFYKLDRLQGVRMTRNISEYIKSI